VEILLITKELIGKEKIHDTTDGHIPKKTIGGKISIEEAQVEVDRLHHHQKAHTDLEMCILKENPDEDRRSWMR